MAYRGVIFDMDGTITAPYLDFLRIKEAAGIGEVDMLDYLRQVNGAEYDRIHELLLQFEQGGVANAKLNRGARTVLRYLKRASIPTALLTRNSRRSVEGVCQKLRICFDIAISREDGPHKPAPEPIWQIARQWNLAPREVLMVGDYKWDVLCATNAGIDCALLTEAGPVPEWGAAAKYQLRRLTELIPILEGKIA